MKNDQNDRQMSVGNYWRRGRDSNPRRACTPSGFQDRRNRPLCHPSAGVVERAAFCTRAMPWSSGVARVFCVQQGFHFAEVDVELVAVGFPFLGGVFRHLRRHDVERLPGLIGQNQIAT